MEIETKKVNGGIQPNSRAKKVFIVRDKDGNPKFDDIHNVPAVIFAALTPSDIEYLNTLRGKE